MIEVFFSVGFEANRSPFLTGATVYLGFFAGKELEVVPFDQQKSELI